MLDHFKYINNVGRFETVALKETLPLGLFTLMFSENGRGKTTLCSVLRSLTTGDAGPILERKRLSTTGAPRVVITIGGVDVSFDGSAWNAAGPRMLIFDDHFVDTNIYSGLAVTASHRQSVHELVIGEQGVLLNRQVQDLTTSIADLQSKVKDCEKALPSNLLGGLTIDDFCALAVPDGLEAKLDNARKSVSVLRDAQNIRDTPDFSPFALPVLPTDAVSKLLGVTLPDIEAAAVEAVSAHFSKLNDPRAEHWVAEGMDIAKGASSCPFCGQDVKKSSLIAHYRAYFSEAYRKHKTTIASLKESVKAEFDGDKLARAQRGIQDAQMRHSFWSKYVSLAAFAINVENVAAAWIAAREGLLEALDRKLAAPLEELSMTATKAFERYNAEAVSIKTLSASLLAQKAAIEVAKEQAAHGSLAVAEAQVTQLETIQRRHAGDMPQKCKDYLAAKLTKSKLEEKKEEARTALNDHRKKVFVTYQTTINDFLIKFNADFRIEALKPSDAGGVTSSGYELVINKTKVGIATPKPGSAPAPSFRTGLSAGDRNTLALAFFFTTLHENAAALSNTIVVLDDPASSLDDGRSWSTSQEIQRLVGRAAQLVVLSHSRPLLTQLWEKADKKTTVTLKIKDAGPEMSTIEAWDAEAAAISEFDRLHKLVREFATSGTGQAQFVAPALRVLLESFLRVAFVEHFPPGKLLGDFLMRAKQLAQAGTPILSAKSYIELDNLREYANQFHHDTSKAWQENVSNVNESQLKGFASRTLSFTRTAHST